jgi:hypothetical protein
LIELDSQQVITSIERLTNVLLLAAIGFHRNNDLVATTVAIVRCVQYMTKRCDDVIKSQRK